MSNIKNTFFVMIVLLFSFSSSLVNAEMRTWVSAKGKYRVEAELMSVSKDGESVTLRRQDNDKIIVINLEQLSKDDRSYVTQHQKKEQVEKEKSKKENTEKFDEIRKRRDRIKREKEVEKKASAEAKKRQEQERQRQVLERRQEMAQQPQPERTCPICRGKGTDAGKSTSCRGSGFRYGRSDGIRCDACSGSGQKNCSSCRGTGKQVFSRYGLWVPDTKVARMQWQAGLGAR